MKEPKRLLEEVDSPLARELLNAGRWSPWPPGVRRQRVLTALGVGLAVGTTKKLSFAAMTTWAKVATIGCVVCAGAGGLFAYRAVSNDVTLNPVVVSQARSMSNESSEASPEGASDPLKAAPLAGEAQKLPNVDLPPPETRAFQPEPVSRASARTAPSKGKDDTRVRAELTLLEQARSELRSGRSESAVTTLATYAQRFPRGVLGLEAEVLRIEALAAAGRTQEAAKRAQRVLDRHPNSVVASRLKRFEAPR